MVQTDPSKEKSFQEWTGRLLEYGIRKENDTLVVSAEVQNILANPKLMEIVFPEKYSLEAVSVLLKKMELKKAFWYLINLYPEDKDRAMAIILKYDRILPMDHVLMSTFYTFSMIDTSVSSIKNGTPTILRPDLVESKLSHVKEMIQYVLYYRNLSEKG